MAIPRRNYRRAQLWGVRASDPEMLASFYSSAVGNDHQQSAQLWPTPVHMIDAILDRDEIEQLSAKVLAAMARDELSS